MNLKEFNALVGQNSYVRCHDKKRQDTAIVDTRLAESHLHSGGTIGWWVRTGYIIVDIDEGKKEALRVIKRLGLKTLMCQTPKGIHLYFKTDKDFSQKIKMILPCGLTCDYRVANKGYVILPFGLSDRKFSKHKEVVDLPLEFTPIANRKDSLYGLKEGDGRNATLFAHLMAYKNKGASDDQIEEMAYAINEEVFGEPMDPDELDQIIENTKKYLATEEGDNPYLLYNAKGVPNQVNNRAICDYFVNKGDVFSIGGECFQYIDGLYVEASSNIRNLIKEMIAVDNLITHARIMECYRLLIDDTRIQRNATDLNKNTHLINFKNGIWDIRLKKLIPHDSKYLQTLQIPHDIKKTKLIWEDTMLYTYLSEQVGLDEENIEMIADYMAYCLTLDHGLKTFMILQGKSNTGKSVLIKFFESMLGTQNTAALSMHELNMRFYPTQLYGKLINCCADNSSLPLSSIENLKKITGGDQIMYEKKGNPNIFFFVPFSKLVFSFNQLPLQLEEKSNAFYKRMRILKMEKELFLNNEYINKLCSKEVVEEVILHLLERLPLKSIPRTEMSDKLVEGLRQDSDSVHSFIANECQLAAKRWCTKRSLYESYVKYCIDTGREAHKKHTFIRHIKNQGFVEARHPKSREYCWKGIGLRKGGSK